MSWGNGLTIAFTGFVLLIGTLVYKATHTRFDLVSEKYYEDEIRYQEQINDAHNAATHPAISVLQDEQYVTLQLPDTAAISGQAWFYYPTDARQDQHISLVTVQGLQRIHKTQLPKGRCLLKLHWVARGVRYYTEQEMQIN